MSFVLPQVNDPPEVWRRMAVLYARESAAREQLLLAAQSSSMVAQSVWPALLSVLRAKALHETALRICEQARGVKESSPAVIYALMGLLLGPADALREAAAQALSSPVYASERTGISLAISLSAKVDVRGPTPRERSALEQWVAVGGEDLLAGREGREVWSQWITGRERPKGLDYALLLATAGASRAALEQFRSVAEHLCMLWGEASMEAGMLWRWLAMGGADGEANTSSGRTTWASSGARVVALSATSVLGVVAALAHASATMNEGSDFDRAVLEQLLRGCAREVLKQREEQAGSAWWAQGAQLAAREAFEQSVDQAVLALCESLQRSSLNAENLLRILCGTEHMTGSATSSKIIAVESEWLSPTARLRVLSVALENGALGARRVVLSEMEARGVPSAVLSVLKEVAKSDPDAITRQHARQLARGEHLL